MTEPWSDIAIAQAEVWSKRASRDDAERNSKMMMMIIIITTTIIIIIGRGITRALKIVNDAAYGGVACIWRVAEMTRTSDAVTRPACSASRRRVNKPAVRPENDSRGGFLACERARRSPPECGLPGDSSLARERRVREFQRLERTEAKQGSVYVRTRVYRIAHAACIDTVFRQCNGTARARCNAKLAFRVSGKQKVPDRIARLAFRVAFR